MESTRVLERLVVERQGQVIDRLRHAAGLRR